MSGAFHQACPAVLPGRRVLLRRAKETDAPSMLRHVWGDEAVYRWMMFPPTHTEEEALQRCLRSIAYQKDHPAWFIALRDTDEAVGLCALRESAPGHLEEAGICLGREHQGMGQGTEVLGLLLSFSFETLMAEDFRYGYMKDNLKSRRLAQRFGFRFDRTFELTRPWDGTVHTIHSCLLTREEYFALPKVGLRHLRCRPV